MANLLLVINNNIFISNHVMMVVNLERGVIIQKCLDFDCRSAEFRGNEFAIPKHILEALPFYSTPTMPFERDEGILSDDILVKEVINKNPSLFM
jgi:hypothetical protein